MRRHVDPIAREQLSHGPDLQARKFLVAEEWRHIVAGAGGFPRCTQQGVPKRALRAEELDDKPDVNDFVFANPAFARRMGITTDDLRFVSLWRQAQAAASDDSDRGVQQRAREYLAKAREQAKDRIVALEKVIRDQKETSVVTLAAKAK